jgi:sugar phosphate isomerase/epimerase
MKTAVIVILSIFMGFPSVNGQVKWEHISSKAGGLDAPNSGKEQTSAAVADFDNDGINDFCISERTSAPALVMYLRITDGWKKYVVEDSVLHIEAGTIAFDVDGDGDMDIIAGGDYRTNQLWWWENPYPDLDRVKSWNRHLIRNTGGNKFHDQIVGDFDGDCKPDLVFWAQGDQTLYFARIPPNPKVTSDWKFVPVYTYFTDGQMEQHGTYPPFKGTNEHEGLAKTDIDGDGIQDIIGGGMWFKYLGNDKFSFNSIDDAYSFSRCAAGQLIKGGRPEVVLAVGDGWAPMYMYEYRNSTWTRSEILPKISNGHSLSIIDFDGDGNQDIWNAEMTLFNNTDATNRILLGDGKGKFPEEIIISRGIDLHESEIADLDGDGDLDILGKPYDGDTPRLDIWLQNGTGEVVAARKGAFSRPFGIQLYTLRFELAKDVPGTLAFLKPLGIRDVEISSYYGNSAGGFKKLLDKNGLKCSSMVFGYDQFEKDPGSIIRDAKMFGAKYVGIGWVEHDKTFGKEATAKLISDFNAFGLKMKNAGLRFFYHPHGYEFNTVDGNMMDVMLSGTKPELVAFELDVFWMKHSGGDPVKYLKNYPGRFELMHLKEIRNDLPENYSGTAPDEASVPLGRGVSNWPEILRQAVRSGVKEYYIEDEAKNAIEQIPVTVNFLKSLK